MLPHELCSQVQNAFRSRQKRVAVPHNVQNLAILSILLREGFISNITRGSATKPSPTEWAAVSPAHKRIWAELKYRNDRPVLSALELVSKPSKREVMDAFGVRRLVSGHRSNFVKPLGMGEIAVVRVSSLRDGGVRAEEEWVEAREAVRRGLGGEVVCRAR